MIRGLFWLAKVMATAIVFSMISLYVTWTAVQTYLNNVMDHYQIGGDIQSIGFSDYLIYMSNGLNILKQADGAQQEQQWLTVYNQEEGEPAADTSAIDSETEKNGASVSPANDTADEPSGSETEEGMADAVPVWNQTGSDASDNAIIVSADSLASTKGQISNEDKLRLFSILIGKLPSDEVQTISLLMEDGITLEELLEIDGIVQQYLSQEEYDELITILERY